MQAAAHRDTIALQYAKGFSDIFQFGVPRFLAALARHGSEERATVSCFLAWLTRFPDTHIARKQGIDVARQVSAEAARLEAACRRRGEDVAAETLLQSWDVSLKSRGINSGASADLTVASLLAARLQGVCTEQFSERDALVVPDRTEGTWRHGMSLHE